MNNFAIGKRIKLQQIKTRIYIERRKSDEQRIKKELNFEITICPPLIHK